MLKRIIYISLIAFMVTLVFLIMTSITEKKTQQDNLSKLIDIKRFNILFKILDINESQSSLVIYYNPDCSFCEEEAKVLKENIHHFDSINLVMVSPASEKEIITFANEFGLNDNAIFLQDTANVLPNEYGIKSTPSILVYTSEGKLKKHFKGETKIEAILAEFN